MSGCVGDLTDKQAQTLTEFRGRIDDLLSELPAQDDNFLLRWLRARSFNVNKSELMIRKHVEFRKKMKVETIVSDWEPPEVIRLYLSGGMLGYDRDGSPLWYDVIGPLDPKGLMMSASKQDFIKTKVRHCEMLRTECWRQTHKLGRNIEGITLIYDCEGLGLKHIWKPAIEAYGEVLTMFEENYPEGLKQLFLIKAPLMFPMAFNLIKPFLSEETRRKIKVLGSDWQEVLRRYVDVEQLPVYYGGTRSDADGDPRCRSAINYGGAVPHSYYVTQQQDWLKVLYDHSVAVGRGSTLQIHFDLPVTGSVLRWQFASRGGDVGFGVFRRTKADVKQKPEEMLQVLPNDRYNAHLVPEDGSLTCTEPGVYVLCFDNSYSLLLSKTLSYNAEVLPPSDEHTHTDQ